MITAYEHGRTAARHGKHVQANPFDCGTHDWVEWRSGYISITNRLHPFLEGEPVAHLLP
jgi:hypothetical protein